MTVKMDLSKCIYLSKEEIYCNLFQVGKTKTACKFKAGRGKCDRISRKEEEE